MIANDLQKSVSVFKKATFPLALVSAFLMQSSYNPQFSNEKKHQKDFFNRRDPSAINLKKTKIGQKNFSRLRASSHKTSHGDSTNTWGRRSLPELGSKMSYIVQPGDTLGKISALIYGTTKKWRELAKFSSIPNPNLIFPGDLVYYQLTEKAIDFAIRYENRPLAKITVQEGETLTDIAYQLSGSADNWKAIWRKNDMITDPDQLAVGTVLYYVRPEAYQAEQRQHGSSPLKKVNKLHQHLPGLDLEKTIQKMWEFPHFHASKTDPPDNGTAFLDMGLRFKPLLTSNRHSVTATALTTGCLF